MAIFRAFSGFYIVRKIAVCGAGHTLPLYSDKVQAARVKNTSSL
jgi:hypothetical protein